MKTSVSALRTCIEIGLHRRGEDMYIHLNPQEVLILEQQIKEAKFEYCRVNNCRFVQPKCE